MRENCYTSNLCVVKEGKERKKQYLTKKLDFVREEQKNKPWKKKRKKKERYHVSTFYAIKRLTANERQKDLEGSNFFIYMRIGKKK
jgi:hypothetical protein